MSRFVIGRSAGCGALLRLTVIAAAIGLVAPAASVAQQERDVAWEILSVGVGEDTRLRDIDPILTQVFMPSFDHDVKVTSIVQRFPIDPRELGLARAKGQGVASFGCLGQASTSNFGTQRVKFDRYGNVAATEMVPGDEDCQLYPVQWNFRGNQNQPGGSSVTVRTVVQRIAGGADPGCFDLNTLCLGQDNRFKAETDWRGPRQEGSAVPLATSLGGGVFWFFDPDNIEMTIKVLDGCNVNNHFWIWAAAATDVEVTLTVTDTVTGSVREYGNDLGTPFEPVLDTQAFATCDASPPQD